MRLGHDGAVDSLTFSQTIPIAIKRLYAIYDYDDTNNWCPTFPFASEGIDWGSLINNNLVSQNSPWGESFPALANRKEHPNSYVWSTMQSEYKVGNITMYRTTIPKCEKLLES